MTKSNKQLYFQHSGKFSAMSMTLTLMTSLLAAAALAVGYGFAIFYIPLIYINIFLTLGLGMAVGFIVVKTSKATHVRNPAVVLMVAMVSGCVAFYVSFAAWVHPVFDYEIFIYQPHHIWRAVNLIAEQGVWSIFNSEPINGFMLYGVWFGEAAIIIIAACVVVYREMSTNAYCESCRQWITHKQYIMPFEPIARPDEMKNKLENGDFMVLESMKPATEESSEFSLIELTSCTTCNEVHLLSIRSTHVTVDKKGNEEEEEKTIVHNMIIDAQSAELIAQLQPPDEPTDGEQLESEESEAEDQAVS